MYFVFACDGCGGVYLSVRLVRAFLEMGSVWVEAWCGRDAWCGGVVGGIKSLWQLGVMGKVHG